MIYLVCWKKVSCLNPVKDTEMTYKEIKNPWSEGWYLFEIYTKEKRYNLRVSGKTISFDGMFYKVNESVSDEVTAIMK